MDATNANTALASAFVEELARSGVRRAVVSPGSRSTPIALALWRSPEIEVSVILDERSAAFFALGAANATGTPAVVACTSGSAAANLHPAVVEADQAAIGLIVLTSDRPPELRGIGAGQTIDQLKLFGSSARWFCEAGTHEADDTGLLHMRATACRAYATAAGEPRAGPAHVNLSWREPLAPVAMPDAVTATTGAALTGGGGGRPLTSVVAGEAAPDGAALADVATMLTTPRRGVIVAGRHADPAVREPVAALARATGFPILAEPTSQLRVGPHDRDLVVSTYDAIARAAADSLAPDLVIRVGDLPTSKPLRQWLASIPGLQQIVIDPAYGWHEPTRTATAILRGGVAPTAEALGARAARSDDRWTQGWLEADRAAAGVIDAELAATGEMTEPAVHRALGPLYPAGSIVYTASSMPIRDQEAFLPGGAGDVRFLCNRGANGLDGLNSSAIGAAAASGAPTFLVTGDLGLCHDLAAFAALRELESPLRIVVLNNEGGGIFHFLPQFEVVDRGEFEALFATPAAQTPEGIAALYDVPYRRVEQIDGLEDALDARGGDTTLIEVGFDRHANVEVHRRLSAAVEAALA